MSSIVGFTFFAHYTILLPGVAIPMLMAAILTLIAFWVIKRKRETDPIVPSVAKAMLSSAGLLAVLVLLMLFRTLAGQHPEGDDGRPAQWHLESTNPWWAIEQYACGAVIVLSFVSAFWGPSLGIWRLRFIGFSALISLCVAVIFMVHKD